METTTLRSEEHTSELQSPDHIVCRLLLEKNQPSACMTSQSIQTVLSPNISRSTTERSALPMRRWISCVRPPIFPLADSRTILELADRGSMAYSAVTHPLFLSLRWGGTFSSLVAVQMTLVSPTSIKTDPSAYLM